MSHLHVTETQKGLERLRAEGARRAEKYEGMLQRYRDTWLAGWKLAEKNLPDGKLWASLKNLCAFLVYLGIWMNLENPSFKNC